MSEQGVEETFDGGNILSLVVEDEPFGRGGVDVKIIAQLVEDKRGDRINLRLRRGGRIGEEEAQIQIGTNWREAWNVVRHVYVEASNIIWIAEAGGDHRISGRGSVIGWIKFQVKRNCCFM